MNNAQHARRSLRQETN